MFMETIEYLLIAFISSAVLIVLSKIILQALIRRPEGYYRDEEFRQEALMLEAGGLSPRQEHETDPEGVNLEAETIIEEVEEAEEHLEGRKPLHAEQSAIPPEKN